MKKLIIILITAILVIAGAFFIKYKLDDKYNYTIEAISEFKYYIYNENDKYGVIDENGNIIIDAKYDNVIIPNPSRELFACYNGDSTEIFNSKKERLFENFEKVEPIKLKSVASTLNYEKNTLTYKENGKFGLINFDGKFLTKNVYDSIENLQPTEGKFLVLQDKKLGIIDLNGNNIIKPEYDLCKSDEYYTEKDGYTKSGFIVANKTADGYKDGYFNYKGKKMLDIAYNDIERILKDDDKNLYLIVSENGKYGLYNKSKKIINNDYIEIVYDDNVDLLLLQKNKKYGVASLSGKILIDTNCEEIYSRGIYLYVSQNGNNKVYDSDMNVVDINFNTTIYNTSNENYKISTILNNNITYYGILDKNKNTLVSEKYRYLEYLFKNYFIAIDENGSLGVINSGGKTAIDMKYTSLQKIKEKNLIQAIDEEGNTEIYSEDMKLVYKMKTANISIEEDYIIVSNEDEKVYIDNSGKVINSTEGLKKEKYPSQIGEYKKEQYTVENIYYVKQK